MICDMNISTHILHLQTRPSSQDPELCVHSVFFLEYVYCIAYLRMQTKYEIWLQCTLHLHLYWMLWIHFSWKAKLFSNTSGIMLSIPQANQPPRTFINRVIITITINVQSIVVNVKISTIDKRGCFISQEFVYNFIFFQFWLTLQMRSITNLDTFYFIWQVFFNTSYVRETFANCPSSQLAWCSLAWELNILFFHSFASLREEIN